MTALNAKAFRGAVPRTSPRLLAGNYAQECLNFKLTSGCLDPVKGPLLVHTSLLASAIGTMYRYRNDGLDYWLVWPRSGVDVVRSTNSQDQYNRLYISGDGEPRTTSYTAAISGPGPFPAQQFTLGVPIPWWNIVISTITGGVATTTEARAYVVTLVSPLGEEGPPCSVPFVSTGKPDAIWNLSLAGRAPRNSWNITGVSNLGGGVVRVSVDGTVIPKTDYLAAYEEVTIAGVVGMTDLNGTFPIKAVDAGGEFFDVALTTTQGYTSGGTITRKAPYNVTGMRQRIYRTVGTNTDYKFVVDLPITDTTYADNKPSTQVTVPLATLNSYTPPKNGRNIRALANGAMCMLAGNELCISEIGKPHSWPLANRFSFAGQGIAMETVGNNAIIATDGFPIVATCTVPELTTLKKLEDCYAPCVAKTSAVDTGSGMAYASFDGLWHITPAGGVKVTDKLYAKDDWTQLQPASFKAAFSNGYYYAMHNQLTGSPRMLVIEWANPDSVSEVSDQFDALAHNPWDGKLYVAKGTKVYEYDADDSNRYQGYWKGPEQQFGPPLNFSIGQVHAQYGDVQVLDQSISAANNLLLANLVDMDGALGMFPLGLIPIATTNMNEQPKQTPRKVQFSFLSNGQVVFSRDIGSTKTFRLPSGFKTEVGALLISSSTRVFSATIAQGAGELKMASE